MVGDQLLAIDGRKISTASLAPLLSRYAPGSKAQLHFYRKDRLLDTTLLLDVAPQQVAVLSVVNEEKCQRWLAAENKI